MNPRMLLVRGGAGITGTALLAAAMWLYGLKPRVEAEDMEPIRSGGEIGQVVSNREFSVRVERVDAARSLAPSLSFGNRPPLRTDGIFVIALVRVMSQREPLRLAETKLETPGGFSYEEASRMGAAEASESDLQPLVWNRAAFIFEVPRERLTGARLVLGKGGLLPQLSAAAEVDLGITGARSAELIRGAAERYDVRKVR